MKKIYKPTVTIGIPAYNEGSNIHNLLKSLLKQKERNYKTKEIIVVSDGSSDNTVMNTKSVHSKLIKIIEGKKRLGKTYRQNQMLKVFKGDILVILDADILPANNLFITSLVDPIIKGKADLVSGKIIPLPTKTIVEKIIRKSVKFKDNMFMKTKSKNSVYMCVGRVRAFSKAYLEKFKWPYISGEDAYSYFFCITKGFKFKYEPKSRALYRLPINLHDHIKQSARFIQSKNNMKIFFNKHLVRRSYNLDPMVVLQISVEYLLQDPLGMISYIGIYCYSSILAKVNDYSNSVWDISASSKKLKLF